MTKNRFDTAAGEKTPPGSRGPSVSRPESRIASASQDGPIPDLPAAAHDRPATDAALTAPPSDARSPTSP
jgi:hypothetical protein